MKNVRRKGPLQRSPTKPPEYEGISKELREQLESSRKKLIKTQQKNTRIVRSMDDEASKVFKSMWK